MVVTVEEIPKYYFNDNEERAESDAVTGTEVSPMIAPFKNYLRYGTLPNEAQKRDVIAPVRSKRLLSMSRAPEVPQSKPRSLEAEGPMFKPNL